MAKLALLFLLVWFACGEAVSISSSECSLPCYDGPSKTYNVGECKSGKPLCVENAFIECSGQRLPSDESCNGLDDDCDGKIDESVYDEQIGDWCGSNTGECSTGSWQCYKGELTCYAEVPPQIETCNGKDDDCNGVVDDIGFTDFCFSGDQQTLAYPPCHAGILTCQNGSFECLHETTAQAEVCDGIDNNCNGRTDENLSTKRYDVVLAIDRSCSMLNGSFTSGVQAMTKAAAEYVGVVEVKFAVIVLPEEDANPVPILIQNLSSSSATLRTVGSLQGLSNSGLEPTYDVIRSVAQNSLGLNYTTGAIRLLFLWTDEAGQTFELPLVHEAAVTKIIEDSDLIFVAFVPQMYADSFDDIALASGGSIHALTDSGSMGQTIITYLDTGCEE